MKVTAIDGKIYLQADFRNLSQTERRFMSRCYFDGAEFGKIQNGVAPLLADGSPLEAVVRMHKTISRHSWVDEVTIDESAQAIFDATEKAFNEECERERLIAELKAKMATAQEKMRNGCGWCEHLKFEHGSYFCKHTCMKCRYKSDEVEMEFDAWKESRALGTKQNFYARPFPMRGCIVYEEGHEAFLKLQAMNEEKQ